MLPYEDSQPQLWSCPPKGRVPGTMSRELLPDSTHPLQGSQSPVPGRILRQRKCSCHRSGELPTLITLIAEAKVCNFHTLLGVKEEVPWLQVPVQDVPLEAELQGWDQLSEWPSGVSLCHVPWSSKWLHMSPSLRPSISRKKVSSVSITSRSLRMFSWSRAFILFTSQKSPGGWRTSADSS